jgi:hypothetical protein
MPSFSLSPLSVVSWSPSSVVVSRLGWEASSRSVLVWVKGLSTPLVCRTRGAVTADISSLVALLRESRDFGVPVYLGVRQGWSAARWFCAATSLKPEYVTELGQPEWEYYGHSSPDTYVEGEGCGIVGCCV